MQLTALSTSGKELKAVETNAFDTMSHKRTVAQAVRVYLSNQRQGTAKTKSRGEVNRTTKKWFKQKHTGNARHGARSAPIFVGGGVAHGPRGNANWTLSMSPAMRKAALQTALAMQIAEKNVSLIEGLETIGTKTKEVVAMIEALKLADKRVLIITDTTIANLIRASRNVGSVLCTRADRLNTYEVMSAHKILMTPEALRAVEAKFSKPAAAKAEAGEGKKAEKPATEEVKEAVKKAVVKKTVRKSAVAKAKADAV